MSLKLSTAGPAGVAGKHPDSQDFWEVYLDCLGRYGPYKVVNSSKNCCFKGVFLGFFLVPRLALVDLAEEATQDLWGAFNSWAILYVIAEENSEVQIESLKMSIQQP